MTRTVLPTFSQIDYSQVENKLDNLLKKNLDTIEKLLTNNTTYTWDNLLQPIDTLNDELHHFWSPIQHLSAVVNAPALRDIMHACLPKLSDYHTHISHNKKLFEAILSIKNSSNFSSLNKAQQKSIENDIRDFKLSGVHLSEDKKEKFSELTKSLSKLMHQFEENVLDATMGWKKYTTDEALLSGIPEHAKLAAKKNAKKENFDGWIFTLEAPDYLAVMTYADSAMLREEMYHAFVTRASELGPNAGRFDNSAIMKNILKDRHELAKLLDFDNFAQYSLSTKMVKHTDDVIQFLLELAQKSLPKAKQEFKELVSFAKTELNYETLNAWDIAYVSEKYRQKEYNISPEDLRPYFPEPQVYDGLFKIIHRLYGITVKQKMDADTWHPDVKCFELLDEKQHTIAHIFCDLYARENKRGGAWMDECTIRRLCDDGKIQLPAAYLTCNFNSPIGNDPALFTHDEVVTLFHECGHTLQHVLTQINVENVSGIRGIPWDAVEVASQFFENWAWEKDSIPFIAKHYKTQADLPADLLERMQRAKNFQTGMHMMRQLEFAIFDFRIHLEYFEMKKDQVQTILNEVRQHFAVYPSPDFNRFQHAFTHIFGGSYAAGYYSYKWAEVMASDAFSLFDEKGIFDKFTSMKFKETFLESGGAKDPLDLFIEFRGRKPSVDALLKYSGIGR